MQGQHLELMEEGGPKPALLFRFPLGIRLQGKADEKAGALVLLTFHSDDTTHLFKQAPDNGQPKPRAPKAAVDGSVRLGKGCEQGVLLGRRDADAGVPHFNQQREGFA